MKYLQYLFLLFFLLTTGMALAQQKNGTKDSTSKKEKKKEKFEDVYLGKTALNRLLNPKFGSIVTGQSNGTAMTNFASFDPVDGSFTFKGSLAIGNKQEPKPSALIGDKAKTKKSSAVSYLSFKITGDLINESYASLFENSKLNTNTLLEGQYHTFMRLRSNKYFGTDEASLNLKRKLAFIDYDNAVKKLSLNNEERRQLIIQKKAEAQQTTANLSTTRTCYDSASLKQQELLTLNNPDHLKKLEDANKFVDSFYKKVQKLRNDSFSLKREIDSLEIVEANAFFLLNKEKEKLEQEYNKKIIAEESNAPLSELRMTWVTLTGGISLKNYYTYSSGATFAEQIKKKELGTFKFGVSWNYYCEDKFPKNIAWLLNIGFLRYRDNNTSRLSTQDINQEVVVKNSAGDTTRKITRKYKVYTDPIIESQVWSFLSNFYLISTSKTSALHIFPSYDLYDGSDTGDLLNLGIGVVISFKNTKKDAPVINAEGYIQFLDVLNKQNADKSLWNRNEIGIRFGVPFNFF